MKSLLEYKNLIMSTGLIPTIVCMILCIFFSDAYVLYACSLAGLLYVLYRLAKPPIYRPNLVLLHATLALVVCSVINLISGDSLIPDRTVPIILEIIILSFSLFYLIEPIFYNKIFSFFNYKISILNCWSTRIIAIFSGIHLFILCIGYISFQSLWHIYLYLFYMHRYSLPSEYPVYRVLRCGYCAEVRKFFRCRWGLSEETAFFGNSYRWILQECS